MRPWRRAMVAAGSIVLAVACAVATVVGWPLTDPGLRQSFLQQVERGSGLAATATGPLTLRLLPRPTIEIRGLELRGLEGAVAVDAEGFRGRLDLWALLGGTVHVFRVGLDEPTVMVDLDRVGPLLGAMLDQTARAGSLSMFQTAGLSLHRGVVQLRSRDPHRDTMLTDLSVTFEWPAGDAPLSLTGSGTWRGVGGSFALDIARPADALAGGETLASTHLRSAALDLDAQGTLSGTSEIRAVGKLAATTPDLPGFLRTIGMPAPQIAGLHRARLRGNAALAGRALSLDPITLDLDDMTFDGALAVHERAGRLGLAGTLATDNIELDPFLDALPTLLTKDGGWSEAPLGTRKVAYDDIDLRISATAARFQTFRMQDGSLSLQSGDGRMELSIGEARAYDGLLKGRVVATLEGDATDIRADATLSRLDLKALFKDVPGRYRASGTMTSHIALGARGLTPADLAGDLTGRGEASIRNGEIGARLLSAMVRAAPTAHVTPLPALTGAGAPFDAALLAVAVQRGTAALVDSWVAWPGSRAMVEGSASLPAQDLDVRARVVPEGQEGGTEGEAVYELKGSWHDLRLKPARPRS